MSDKAMELERLFRACDETHGAAWCTDIVPDARVDPKRDGLVVQSADLLSLADTLAAGRVFLKLREAGKKDYKELLFQLAAITRLSENIYIDNDLPALEAIADKVLGGEG